MDIILYKKSGTARLFQVQAVPITNDEGKMDSLPRAVNVGDNFWWQSCWWHQNCCSHQHQNVIHITAVAGLFCLFLIWCRSPRDLTVTNRGYSRLDVSKTTGPRQMTTLGKTRSYFTPCIYTSQKWTKTVRLLHVPSKIHFPLWRGIGTKPNRQTRWVNIKYFWDFQSYHFFPRTKQPNAYVYQEDNRWWYLSIAHV